MLATAPAQAVVMNFESLAVNNNFAINTVVSPYTESGFTLSSPGLTFGFRGTLNSLYPGSTALFGNLGNQPITLTKVGGGAFNLSSIDLTDLNGFGAVSVSFTGTRADTSTVNRTFTTDAILTTLETFNFPDFTNLVSVNWSQGVSTGAGHQFDNINVSAVTTTAVPEPFTILGTIFGVGSSVVMKRRLAKAQADNRSID
jgi:hypothetical protein